MTTIVDPAGTPIIIYRDQAITKVAVAAAGSSGSDATQLTRYSSVNIVAVTTTGANQGVKLPAGEDGDLFEVYPLDNGIKFYNPDGSFLVNGGYKYIRYVSGAWRVLV